MLTFPPAHAAGARCSPACQISVRSVPSGTATRVSSTTVVSDRTHSTGGTPSATCNHSIMESAGSAARSDDVASRLAQFEPDPEGKGAVEVPLDTSDSEADDFAWVTWDDAESELSWVIDELARIMSHQ